MLEFFANLSLALTVATTPFSRVEVTRLSPIPIETSEARAVVPRPLRLKLVEDLEEKLKSNQDGLGRLPKPRLTPGTYSSFS